jgi:sulfur carrier protein
MQIIVNDRQHEVEAQSNLQQLLQELGITGGRIAVELNGEIVPRSGFEQCLLKVGDSIEIVQAIGGG